MKPRHTLALVLAFVGWYLMVPPRPHKGTDPITSFEPLNQWVQLHAFDTAAACEQARQMMLDTYQAKLRTTPEDDRTQVKFAAFSDAECVISNDPRLAK